MRASFVIADTEYTTWPGALESGWSAPGQYREIVQIAAVRIAPGIGEVDDFDFLVRPWRNPQLSPLFIELTRITQEDVDRNGLQFPRALAAFMDFVGSDPVVVMNADEAVFRENCEIHGIDFRMPSFHRLRPFLEEHGVDLTNHSSGDLHQLTDSPIRGHTHNALHDVRSMATWIGYAERMDWLSDISVLPTGAPVGDPRSLRAPSRP